MSMIEQRHGDEEEIVSFRDLLKTAKKIATTEEDNQTGEITSWWLDEQMDALFSLPPLPSLYLDLRKKIIFWDMLETHLTALGCEEALPSVALWKQLLADLAELSLTESLLKKQLGRVRACKAAFRELSNIPRAGMFTALVFFSALLPKSASFDHRYKYVQVNAQGRIKLLRALLNDEKKMAQEEMRLEKHFKCSGADLAARVKKESAT